MSASRKVLTSRLSPRQLTRIPPQLYSAARGINLAPPCQGCFLSISSNLSFLFSSISFHFDHDFAFLFFDCGQHATASFSAGFFYVLLYCLQNDFVFLFSREKDTLCSETRPPCRLLRSQLCDELRRSAPGLQNPENFLGDQRFRMFEFQSSACTNSEDDPLYNSEALRCNSRKWTLS